MNSYQIIIYILKEIAKWRAEYPPALLALRRAAFVAQIEARKRGESASDKALSLEHRNRSVS